MLITVKPISLKYSSGQEYRCMGSWGVGASRLDLVFEIEGVRSYACLRSYFGYLSRNEQEALGRHMPTEILVRTRRHKRYGKETTLYIVERKDLAAWGDRAEGDLEAASEADARAAARRETDRLAEKARRLIPPPPRTIDTALNEGWMISRESGRQVILVKDAQSITRYR